jgi:hypothetical protein
MEFIGMYIVAGMVLVAIIAVVIHEKKQSRKTR